MSRKALRFGKFGRTALLAGLAASFFAFGDAAFAQRAGDNEEEDTGQTQGTIDERTGEILNEAIEFLNVEDYASARASMGELRMDRLSPYERSRAEQILFQIAYASENYDEARTHLQAAIDAGGLNETEIQNLRFQIAQTYLIEERWAEGARALEEWFRTATNPNSQAYYLLAVAYYSQGDSAAALAPAERAVELSETPQEGWLQLVLALYVDQERWRDAVPLLERLVTLFPDKKTYWNQLSSVHGQLENYREALAVMQLAYEADLLTESSEYLRLADLLLFNEVPYRGATILEAAIQRGDVEGNQQAYEKLANCWIAAREFERALEPLETAAERARNGDLYVRLGEVNMQLEDWGGMAAALRRALEKGGLRDTANARLLLGIALFSQDNYEGAKEQFDRIADSEAHGDTARGYLQLIEARLQAQEGDEEGDEDAEAEDAEESASAEDAAAPEETLAPAEDTPADGAPAEAPATP